MKTDSKKSLRKAIDNLPPALQEVAEQAWQRICDRHAESAVVSAWSDENRNTFVRMLGCSQYAGEVCLRYWDWFAAVVASGSIESAWVASSEKPSGTSDEAKALLREERNKALVSILWCEYTGNITVAESLARLSVLADGLVVQACDIAQGELAERFGVPVTTTGASVSLLVIAMGKLGGFELNLSSDIDVFFVYEQECETDGRRSISAHEYFTRLARRIVSLLDDYTSDGFVYRVDTRLRPFGDSGPLVVSFKALESYLLTQARNWERYAYVKARVVNEKGNEQVSSELMQELLRPFVYRRYLDYGVFESLREMKSLIEVEVERRELKDNIKLGAGGIREIEFIVQSLQLVRGGRNLKLQLRSLQSAIQELIECGDLGAQTGAELAASYDYLRRLENFIQAIRDQQTHDLPEDALDQQRLACAMQYDNWESLARDIDRHRERVSQCFQEVAFRTANSDEAASETSDITSAWKTGADVQRWTLLFDNRGFRGAERLAEEIVALSKSLQAQQPDANARARLLRLIPQLLAIVQDLESPAEALARVGALLQSIVRRSAYIALLNENSAVLRRLVDLSAQSAFLADQISRFPLLLDEMLDPRLLSGNISAAVMRSDLQQRLSQVDPTDSEALVETLARFQRATIFRIAIADISETLPIMRVSDALTELAEIVLENTLRIAWRDLIEKHGKPEYTVDGVRREAGLGVIAYGKLGGLELSYGSDLDIVFLHDSHGSNQQTSGTAPLDNSMFFARLVRRLVHFLNTQTPSGALYEVDTRLRPSGGSGLLVINVQAFERYQEENAWTWEHQALLRSRPVAGSTTINREFEAIRRNTLTAALDADELVSRVHNMRQRMRKQLDKSDAELFDLKQGIGGIGDLEFIVQYLVLRHAAQSAAVVFYTDNIRQLGALAAVGALPQADVSQLQDIYREYRSRLHRLALDGRPPLVGNSEFAEQRLKVSALWERELGAGAA